MLELQDELGEFIEKLKNTEVYQEYIRQRDRLSEQPELKQRVDEFRRKNYELQTRNFQDNVYDEMDRFQRENESFREIPMVHDYLAAELALCRMIQKVTASIVEAVAQDFE
jgi:cell fate (sporulation/competence/biofilm development) regulator YlbF (YheA/YmcA/DUF963 family)